MSDVPGGVRGRVRGGVGAIPIAVGVVLALTTACSSGPGTEGGAEAPATGQASVTTDRPGAGDESGDETPASAPTEPVDVAAALSEFEPPPATTGLAAPRPEECPGADAEPMLSVFEDARPFQATSVVLNPPDAADDEVHLQCRLSYEVALLPGDECTVMEVRDVTFTPDAEGVLAGDGSLATTSVMTYFVGGARKDGVVLDYTLSAGCDDASDLSDLETQFRSVWEAHRDRFLATSTYERP